MLKSYSDICYDSRKVTAGALFVAVKNQTDLPKYVEDAKRRGGEVLFADAQTLATLSAEFFGFPAKSLTLIGVTGTNGKTTVTTLLKQVYEAVTGNKAGLIGTIEHMIGNERISAANTTPESRDLQELLAQMRDAGCSAVFMEVSSHALELERVFGLRFAVGVLTNLTQDHLDFHGSMKAYLTAKLKLVDVSERFIADKRVLDAFPEAKTRLRSATLVDGSDNAETVLAVCDLLGLDRTACQAALNNAVPAKGRLELVPTPNGVAEGVTVIIDYAHTPDALEHTLTIVRKRYPSSPITVLFGCGGDRDRGKRPVMGEIAVRLADKVIVTSDNPRTEDPQAIIDDILVGVDPDALASETVSVVADREAAIYAALAGAENGEVIVLAGKGHEDYQIVGKETRHLDEHEVVAVFAGGNNY
jgi:UDP-N-acetylmuramoyl-L-alanyl-D-glutamate--2,6-diaminopimelate ligase